MFSTQAGGAHAAFACGILNLPHGVALTGTGGQTGSFPYSENLQSL